MCKCCNIIYADSSKNGVIGYFVSRQYWYVVIVCMFLLLLFITFVSLFIAFIIISLAYLFTMDVFCLK